MINLRPFLLLALLLVLSCKEQKGGTEQLPIKLNEEISYAKGFSIERSAQGVTIIKVSNPWPDATEELAYALVPRKILPTISLDRDAYDAIIPVPVNRLVATSTTHIPALETLGVADRG